MATKLGIWYDIFLDISSHVHLLEPRRSLSPRPGDSEPASHDVATGSGATQRISVSLGWKSPNSTELSGKSLNGGCSIVIFDCWREDYGRL